MPTKLFKYFYESDFHKVNCGKLDDNLHIHVTLLVNLRQKLYSQKRKAAVSVFWALQYNERTFEMTARG